MFITIKGECNKWYIKLEDGKFYGLLYPYYQCKGYFLLDKVGGHYVVIKCLFDYQLKSKKTSLE